MDFEHEIKNEFLLEAKELLEQAEESFLDFERDPSEMDVIDNIFRLFHTLKGSSFTAGFEAFGKFTHKVENLLTSLKDGSLSVDDMLCDVLLRSNDILDGWISALTEDHEADFQDPDIEEILAYIESLNLDGGKSDEPLVTFGFFDDDLQEKVVQATEAVQPPPAPAQENVVPIKKEPSTHPTVMIVDDEPDIQELIEIYLEEYTLNIVKAPNGRDALEIAQQNPPDLILSDLRMPEMDGIEFIEKLREINKQVPVVFISGAADREDMISFIKLGSFGFIEKPISREMLLALVRQGLYVKQMKESMDKISMLNFKMHMACYQLIRTKDDKKREKIQNDVKALLDQVSELNNKMLELKMLEIA